MIGARNLVALRTSTVAIVTVLVASAGTQACSADTRDAQGGTARTASAATVAKRAGSGSISLVAAPVGQTRSGRDGVTPGAARFRPARPGRTVLIQGRVGQRWKTVGTATQNRSGVARFTVRDPSIAYRAVARSTRTDRGVVTRAVRSANVGAPTWRDEFAGSGPLNSTKWQPRQEGYRGGLRKCAEVRRGNAFRQNGAAVLKVSRLAGKRGAKTKRCPHGQFANAMVKAGREKYHFTYGFAAARVKFQSARGLHSGVWLQVPDGTIVTPGRPSTGAEIDIAEYFGDNRPKGGLARYVHWMNAKQEYSSLGGEFRSRSLLPKGKEWSDSWHVFSVEWTPKRYIFRVDGIPTLTTSKSVSQRPEQMILSSVTSDWELSALKPGSLPAVTKYDWVRVWAR